MCDEETFIDHVRVLGSNPDLIVQNPAFKQLDLNRVVEEACTFGHLKLLKYITKEYAENDFDWNLCLDLACRHSHTAVAKWAIACAHKTETPVDLRSPFLNACYTGDLKVAETVFPFGDAKWLMEALYYSCLGGHRTLVNFVIKQATTRHVCINWSVGLAGACHGGHALLAEQMINRGACKCRRA